MMEAGIVAETKGTNSLAEKTEMHSGGVIVSCLIIS